MMTTQIRVPTKTILVAATKIKKYVKKKRQLLRDKRKQQLAAPKLKFSFSKGIHIERLTEEELEKKVDEGDWMDVYHKWAYTGEEVFAIKLCAACEITREDTLLLSLDNANEVYHWYNKTD